MRPLPTTLGLDIKGCSFIKMDSEAAALCMPSKLVHRLLVRAKETRVVGRCKLTVYI